MEKLLWKNYNGIIRWNNYHEIITMENFSGGSTKEQKDKL